jgi:hypothetical protein
MDTRPLPNLTIEEVQDQFADWRKTRKTRGPIPESLWEAALALAKDHSINEISKALRLNYMALKERVQAYRSVCLPEAVAQPAFLEFAPLGRSMPSSECSVEMEDMNGTRMKICFKGHTGLDLLELAKVFWGQKA